MDFLSTNCRVLAARVSTSVVVFLALPCIANAQPTSKDFQAEIWAASCAACHGTSGKAQGTGLYIADKSESELTSMLLAFKSGKRPATIMHQHAKGYSDDELRRISRVFANAK